MRIGSVRGYSPGAVRMSKIPKCSAGKRKTALVSWSCGRKAAIVGIPHEKVGIRARMRSASIVRVGRIAILAAWDSVWFMIPRRAEGKQKRMVGGTMICLSYLARASICFPFRGKLRLFLCQSRLSHHRGSMRKSTTGGASCTTNSNASRTRAPSRY